MYQALYRKWRPTTFSDIVGQEHITRTLQTQVDRDRLSHAYLFTGTRGTGKTTCAKILSRGVNCISPIDGNPCNSCPSCLGISDGSILDVLELDAASNSGVDHVRALRDEAHYSPASVKKRVYIIDEVHALSAAAFNALLKILEEPPSHLMFILATTELHKVPATIVSRCQQFAFKRILPQDIANRLSYVAGQEGISLSLGGANLLARLADGGLRDALSLLDQCVGVDLIDESHIYTRLGLAGSLETARLMRAVATHQTEEGLHILSTLYQNGGDVATILDELSALARDLLLRHTAPNHAAALYSGGFDDTTLSDLSQLMDPTVLLHHLSILQETVAKLPLSRNRRTDGELCLMRLCMPMLDQDNSAILARLARLEQLIEQPRPVVASVPVTTEVAPTPQQVPAPQSEVVPPTTLAPQSEVPPPSAPPPDTSHWSDEPPPPWECAPPPEEGDFDFAPPEPEPSPAPVSAPPSPPKPTAPPANRPPVQPPIPPIAPIASVVPTTPLPTASHMQPGAGDGGFWSGFASGLKGKVSPIAIPYLCNPSKVSGRYGNGILTLWVDGTFTKMALDKPSITTPLAKVTSEFFGVESRVTFMVGTPPPLADLGTPVVAAPAISPTAPPTTEAPPTQEDDPLDDLLLSEDITII